MQINQYPAITSIGDGDFFLIQTASDGAYKSILASDLQAYFGSSTSTNSSSTPGLPATRTFSLSGDNNGVFYYLGTSKGATAWNNPSGVSIGVTASSVGFGSVELLTNRADDQFYTGNIANSWVEFDLGTLALKCNYYCLRNRNQDIHYLRNWQLQGSNDGNTWAVLDDQVNNSTLNTPSQWLSLPVTSSVQYSKFRIFETGINSSNAYYVCLGEVELYGVLSSAGG